MSSRVKTVRSRVVLSTDTIAEAAQRLTLEQPTIPLTLARLGAELGADPTALYRHYRSRDELLLDLADRIYSGPNSAFRHDDDDWRRSLTRFAFSMRDELLRRPALVAEVGSRFTGGPNERRTMEIQREILRRAGFDEDVVNAQTRALGSMGISHAVMTASLMTLPESERDIDIAIAHEVHGDQEGFDSRDYEQMSFAIILETYLDGLAARLARHQGGAG